MNEQRTSDERAAFEKHWKALHPAREYPRRVWLKRDDIWNKDGYGQPTVNFDWQFFQAGVAWARKKTR